MKDGLVRNFERTQRKLFVCIIGSKRQITIKFVNWTWNVEETNQHVKGLHLVKKSSQSIH